MSVKRDFLPPKSDLVFKWLFGDERNIDLLTALLKSVLDLPDNEYAEVTIVDPHLLRDYDGDKLGILFTLYDHRNDVEFTDLVELHTLELSKLPGVSDNTELYDWLRFLRAERKEELDMLAQTNPQINKAVAVLMELSADEKARMLYESREKQRRDEASRMKGAIKDVARNLLKRNRPIDEIMEDTGLTRDEVERLRD
jgi:hypothetical protein